MFTRGSGLQGGAVQSASVATTPNDGVYTDNLGRVTGTYRYRVSHPAGTPISNEVAVAF